MPTYPRRSRLRSSLACLAWSAPLLVGCASQPVDAPAATEPPPSEVPGGAPAAHPQPPDGRWLVDEEGRQFFVRDIPRAGLRHEVEAGGRSVLVHGVRYSLHEETPDLLRVRIYRTDHIDVAGAEAEAAASDEGPGQGVARPVDELSFRRFDAGLPRQGQWRQGFELADMNGDGHLDIVHGPPRKGRPVPRVFLGDGRGAWRPWSLSIEGPQLDYGDVAVADFDADGNLDMALGVHLRGLQILIGDGAGRFRPWGRGLEYWAPGSPGSPPVLTSRNIAAADLDADGRPDLVAVGEGPRLGQRDRHGPREFNRGNQGPHVFLNEGEGRFRQVPPVGENRRLPYGDSLAIADLDGDGSRDLVVGSSSAGQSQLLFYQRGGEWEGQELPEAPGGPAFAVATADFDADGATDVAVGYFEQNASDRWGGVDVHYGGSSGWQRVPLRVQRDATSGVTALATGDVDGDGRPDLVALTGEGERWIFLSRPDRQWVQDLSPELEPGEEGCRGYAAAVADLDGDGRGEVVAAFAGEPGGEILMGEPALCPSQGSLEVWTPQPRAE